MNTARSSARLRLAGIGANGVVVAGQFRLGDGARDGAAAWFGQGFQPRRDIHALAVAVLALDDHIAEIYAHSHVDALV